MDSIIKPMSIRRRECIDKICAAINEAGLPAFAVVDIVERILRECNRLADDEYMSEMQNYQQQLDNPNNTGTLDEMDK